MDPNEIPHGLIDPLPIEVSSSVKEWWSTLSESQRRDVENIINLSNCPLDILGGELPTADNWLDYWEDVWQTDWIHYLMDNPDVSFSWRTKMGP